MNRRTVVGGMLVTMYSATAGLSFAGSLPTVNITKGRGCGCCTAWAEIVRRSGFPITEDELLPADLMILKNKLGVPGTLISCHTALVKDYVIEGHVPPKEIKRLVAEQPEILGLAVAGMPYGSPGMGSQEEREAYDVIAFKRDGFQDIYATYKSASK